MADNFMEKDAVNHAPVFHITGYDIGRIGSGIVIGKYLRLSDFQLFSVKPGSLVDFFGDNVLTA
jgi:hypothetical protein